jgi:hypothetical protein
MCKGYDYKIVTKKLNRPLGENHYVAMLESLTRIDARGRPTSLPTPEIARLRPRVVLISCLRSEPQESDLKGYEQFDAQSLYLPKL